MKGSVSSIEQNHHALTTHWENGRQSVYHYFWLRDNCPQLKHPTTNHRIVETSNIPDSIHPTSVDIIGEEKLRIIWAYDKIVNNRRVLHGRMGFSSGGNRHLQSCYIEADEMFSRLAILRQNVSEQKV